MKTLIPILIILALSSCVTQKKCNAKFPPSTNTQVHDSIIIKDSIIYKDREVPYKIPGDTVYLDKLIPGIPKDINVPPMTLVNTYAIAISWIENSRLKMKLVQKDQVITFKLDSADKIAKHWEYKYRNEKQTIILPPVKYTSGFAKFCIWFTVIVAIGLIGWAALKIYKLIKP